MEDKHTNQHQLLFINPVLHEGINVTVRRGPKWFKRAQIGDGLNIFKTGNTNVHQRKGYGIVVGLSYLMCNMIPAEWLMLEHDPTCRDQHGLNKAMIRAYPDFQLDELVTVILFDNIVSIVEENQ